MGSPARLRLLLDTHVWLWSRLEPERLGPRLASEIQDPDNELWLSPISVWETMLLIERGRIELAGDPAAWIRGALRTFPVRDAPLTREVALLSRSVELPHEDPVDRFIAASAIVHELTLATADERLLRTRQYRTRVNR